MDINKMTEINNKIENIVRAAAALEVVQPITSTISDKDTFEAFIATLIDRWGADNNKSDEEILSVARTVAAVQASVYGAEHRAEKIFS